MGKYTPEYGGVQHRLVPSCHKQILPVLGLILPILGPIAPGSGKFPPHRKQADNDPPGRRWQTENGHLRNRKRSFKEPKTVTLDPAVLKMRLDRQPHQPYRLDNTGLDTRFGWRIRHPQAAKTKGKYSLYSRSPALAGGLYLFWGHGSGAKENAPTAP